MIISIVGLLVLSIGGFATAKLVQTDKVDYEFVNDPALVGQLCFRFEKPSYYILKKNNSTDMPDFRPQSIVAINLIQKY